MAHCLESTHMWGWLCESLQKNFYSCHWLSAGDWWRTEGKADVNRLTDESEWKNSGGRPEAMSGPELHKFAGAVTVSEQCVQPRWKWFWIDKRGVRELLNVSTVWGTVLTTWPGWTAGCTPMEKESPPSTPSSHFCCCWDTAQRWDHHMNQVSGVWTKQHIKLNDFATSSAAAGCFLWCTFAPERLMQRSACGTRPAALRAEGRPAVSSVYTVSGWPEQLSPRFCSSVCKLERPSFQQIIRGSGPVWAGICPAPEPEHRLPVQLTLTSDIISEGQETEFLTGCHITILIIVSTVLSSGSEETSQSLSCPVLSCPVL